MALLNTKRIDWKYFAFIIYVVAQQLDFNPIATDCYSSVFLEIKESARTWYSHLCSAVQEVAEGINLSHTSPQSRYMVVSAEGNDIFPSSAHFKSLVTFDTKWTGEEGEDISLCWLWEEKDTARWVSLS